MKVCKIEGCNNFCFGGGYCRNHQWKRTAGGARKPIAKHKAIKPRSEKMKVLMELYNQAKDKAIAEARKKGPVLCFACNKEIHGFIDWHHTEGRNENLLDEAKMVFMHRQHHTDIHSLSVDQLLLKPWYAIYLVNLKNLNVALYEKEYGKRTKLDSL